MKNLQSFIKSFSLTEGIVFVAFILYLIFPIQTPEIVSTYVESPLGLLILFCSAIGLFFYTNPVLAVLFVFISYTLLRRSANVTLNKPSYIQNAANKKDRNKLVRNEGMSSIEDNQYTPFVPETTKPEKREEINSTPVAPSTLEEDIVNRMAPIGKSELPVFTEASFSPVSTNINNAARL